MKQQGHQGDVQIRQIDSLPQNCKSIPKKPLALGEKSGHQHVVCGDYEMFEDDKGQIFVSVGNAGAVLNHIHKSAFRDYADTAPLPVADHKPITLNPGVFLIGIHKRYNPFSKIWEAVLD
jgi:hypothetical protein